MSYDSEVLRLNRTPPLLRLAAVVPLTCGAMCGLFAFLPVLGIPYSLKIGEVDRETAERVFVVALAALALALGALGVLMLWGCWETVIDRRRRIMRRRWNLGKWRRERRWPLDHVTHVELRFEDNRGGGATWESGTREPAYRFLIVLCGSSAAIPVVQRLSETVARRDADRVAEFLELELHDHVPDLP